MGNEIEVYENRAITPQNAGQMGQEAISALMAVIDRTGDVLKMGGKKYLSYEHWQMLGVFAGQAYGGPVTAKVIDTEKTEDGYIARAEAVCNGQAISAAEAECNRSEKNWAHSDDFKLRSMAQTRACAKALRNVLAWVVALEKGFAATPAEEMDGEHPKEKPAQSKSNITGTRTDKQKNMIMKLVGDLGWNETDAKDWLEDFAGVRSTSQLDKEPASRIITALLLIQAYTKLGWDENDFNVWLRENDAGTLKELDKKELEDIEKKFKELVTP
jgi:hypothetical protein